MRKRNGNSNHVGLSLITAPSSRAWTQKLWEGRVGGERMAAYSLRNVTRLVATVAVMLMAVAHVAHGKAEVPPILPKAYQGSGNVLQALLNQSWPAAQGVSSTLTFFAPQSSAIKKYPCLFSDSDAVSKSVATSVLQYHIIAGRTFSSQQIKNLAQKADYMVTIAFNGKKMNFTIGGNKLNGYSSINDPDIGSKEYQAIHGIKTVLLPLV
ncbi:uncharacterized protein [Physcomitrium patens]|uniref:FAS1 domain-containing protein n=1 Tax=Physcomitrium patens TaxID=3218 RepID=A0A2K1JVJ0_PHYPA|nr:uncharacterized protein LOC112288178 isoform X2 [Physcomitrium patens]PNR45535.1 hypothetical protein PHYPA_015306 [Physcomitrium patens]|eukprot:XP_024387861.1 uncharacterized protein LOC112288178 isoform X2 [Physcomitrella patens]